MQGNPSQLERERGPTLDSPSFPQCGLTDFTLQFSRLLAARRFTTLSESRVGFADSCLFTPLA